MADDANPPPPDEITADALKAFGDQYVLDIWRKATSRRHTDPEGAITAARALLEAVCKRILHDAGIKPLNEWNFPTLYQETAKTLDIAPSEKTATKFGKLLKACEEIITTVSSLRNELGDAHGHAVAQATPTQHAELAVTLAGAMATFLLATWGTRQQTLGQLITRYLEDEAPNLGLSQLYTLKMVARMPLGQVAARRITPDHIIAHCRLRRDAGVKPQTVNQDVTYTGRFLKAAKKKWNLDLPIRAVDEARPALNEEKLIAKSMPRARRMSHDEFDNLIAHYRMEDRRPKNKIHMGPVMEFAVWTARSIGEICSLRWDDLNTKDRTCLLRPGPRSKKKPVVIRLVDKAWEIVQAQPRTADPRLFPYNAKSCQARHTMAKRALNIPDLRFEDLKYEGISRLLDAGYRPDEVARFTGLGHDLNKIAEIQQALRKRSEQV